MKTVITIAVLAAAGLLVWFLFFKENKQAEPIIKPKPPVESKPINVGVLWQPGVSVSERLTKTTNQLAGALQQYCKTNPGVGICPTA